MPSDGARARLLQVIGTSAPVLPVRPMAPCHRLLTVATSLVAALIFFAPSGNRARTPRQLQDHNGSACVDSSDPFAGSDATCDTIRANPMYCTDATYGATVREHCPVTCGVCADTSHMLPPSLPPPAGCEDSPAPFEGSDATCATIRANPMYCTDATYGVTVREHCPVTCGVCAHGGGGDDGGAGGGDGGGGKDGDGGGAISGVPPTSPPPTPSSAPSSSSCMP